MIHNDAVPHATLAKEMKAFISAIFGNDGWIKLTEARWLRKKQGMHEAEYDPTEQNAVKVYVKGGYRPQVPRHILDELPTHGSDQFGGLHLPEPQAASKDIYETITGRKAARVVGKSATKSRIGLESLA